MRTTTNPYIDVRPNVNTLELSSKDVLYETVDSRAASQQNITFNLDAKGDDSLLCANAYITAHFRLVRNTTAGNATANQTITTRDRVCLRNNFFEEMMLNATFNYQGTNINSRPYLACKEMSMIFDDNEYQKKYGGVGGGWTNLDSIEGANRQLEPIRGQLLRNPPAGDGDALNRLNFVSNGRIYDNGNTQSIVVDDNSVDPERMSKIEFLRELINANASTTDKFRDFKITFPVRMPPFKGHRKGLFYDAMSDCLPYVKNSSLNLQIKQGINGITLEEFFIDMMNGAAQGGATVAPDFVLSQNFNGSNFNVVVHPENNWQIHLRWFQSPVPLQDTYNIKTFRLDHYLKTTTKVGLGPNVQHDTNQEVISDLIRVGSKPEYLLIYVGEDILGKGRGNDVNFKDATNVANNSFKPGYLKAANVEIKGLDLQISNQQGVLTSSMEPNALKYYTLENVCKNFSQRNTSFKNYKNFVFIRTADIAAPNGPAGILQNCNIKVSARLGYYGYNTTTDGVVGAMESPDYHLNVCLVYTHSKIQVSDRGVVLMDQDSEPGEYDQLVIQNLAELGPGMRPSGIKTSYKSNF